LAALLIEAAAHWSLEGYLWSAGSWTKGTLLGIAWFDSRVAVNSDSHVAGSLWAAGSTKTRVVGFIGSLLASVGLTGSL
jgi:hypothetical protein